MKRLFVILVAASAIIGCNERMVFTCGNGELDEGEACDGVLYADGIVLHCDGGIAGDVSKVRCTGACTLDVSEACVPVCGNGIVEPGEDCDGGVNFDLISAECEEPNWGKLRCESCKMVDDGVCGGNGTCGNGKLDEGELCDGALFAEAVRICPANMVVVNEGGFKCADNCMSVDVGNACRPEGSCGNGALDAYEECDGGLFDESAVARLSCSGAGEELDVSALRCAFCGIDASAACVGPYSRIFISEVVPALEEAGEYMTVGGLAIEIANLGAVVADLSQCTLGLYGTDGTPVTSYSLEDLGKINPSGTVVLCSQASEHFGDACKSTISDNLIQSHLSSTGFMTLECGGGYVDIFNVNSFVAAVSNGALDFVRHCDADRVTEPANAFLGEGWSITASGAGAPVYGLGSHCGNQGAGVSFCRFEVDRTEITERGQNIAMSLEIAVPGVTDVTAGTDEAAGMEVQFVTGRMGADGSVEKMSIHGVSPEPDLAWSDEGGTDRYVGTLHTFDTYEGFIYGDDGVYVLDAAVSFDNGASWTYCGPEGIVSDYAQYDGIGRNVLTVAFDDAECGDGRLSGWEVCDGESYIEDALVCEKPGQIVINRDNLMCYGCNLLVTANACGEKPDP